MYRNSQEYTILNAKGATGIGKSIDVTDFRHAVVYISTDGGGDAALTCKIQGSVSEDAPTFSAAQSVSNQWDYIQAKDLEDGSSIDGDTGFVVAGADDYRMWEVNINGLKWLNAIVTAHSEGEVTVKVRLFSND